MRGVLIYSVYVVRYINSLRSIFFRILFACRLVPSSCSRLVLVLVLVAAWWLSRRSLSVAGADKPYSFGGASSCIWADWANHRVLQVVCCLFVW